MAKTAEDDDLVPPRESRSRLERLARLLRQLGHADGLNPVQWEALRYLDRANALSNSPGALARYLGSTKGTISQTLASLEAKGLVAKQVKPQDQRSVMIVLTSAGRSLLEKDNLLALEQDIAALGGKTRRRFDRALTDLLQAESTRQGEPSFGTCMSCRYFRETAAGGSAYCMKVNAAVSKDETALICVEHVAR